MLQFQLVNRRLKHFLWKQMPGGSHYNLWTKISAGCNKIKLNEAIHACKVLSPTSSTYQVVLQKQELSLTFIIQLAFSRRLKMALAQDKQL